jgi:hypothetical protein
VAKGDLVAPHEKVVRLIRHIDYTNGIVGSSAFDRPEKDHDGLSVVRRYVFAADDATDLRIIREILSAWRTVKPSQKLVQLGVSDILQAGVEAKRALSVIEDPIAAAPPKPANEAHALICGLPFLGSDQGTLDAVTASDLLARKISLQDVLPAIESSLAV